MSLIAVDIGNTTIEFAVFESKKIVKKFFISSENFNKEELILVLNDNKDILHGKDIIISSVVRLLGSELKLLLEEIFSNNVYLLDHDNYNLILKTENGNTKEIGMDLICKSAATIIENNTDCLVLDVGSATVLQYINKQNQLQNASISLGLSKIYKALFSETDLLPNITPKKVTKALGTSTETAIQSGVFWMYVGGVNLLINKSIEETKCYNIIITGGLSGLIYEDLEINSKFIKHDKDLIFRGIMYIYYENIDKLKSVGDEK